MFIPDLTKRLPQLQEVMPALEHTLRWSGITSRSDGTYGGPASDVQLTALRRLCVDYLSADPASIADTAE
jgi:hypothetical protein